MIKVLKWLCPHWWKHGTAMLMNRKETNHIQRPSRRCRLCGKTQIFVEPRPFNHYDRGIATWENSNG